MVVLATMGEKSFVPSLLEAPGVVGINTKSKSRSDDHAARPNYSIDTVRRLKQSLKKSDRLFFLIGIDAFDDIATWHEPEALLQECEFIVASRPGYSLADVANALPEKLRPAPAVIKPISSAKSPKLSAPARKRRRKKSLCWNLKRIPAHLPTTLSCAAEPIRGRFKLSLPKLRNGCTKPASVQLTWKATSRRSGSCSIT